MIFDASSASFLDQTLSESMPHTLLTAADTVLFSSIYLILHLRP